MRLQCASLVLSGKGGGLLRSMLCTCSLPSADAGHGCTQVTRTPEVMNPNVFNTKISSGGMGLRRDPITPVVASCTHVLRLGADAPDLVIDEAGSMHGSSCCPYAEAHISSLENF